eukprot:scaffold4406_cov112-Isochrysis_galbana.AAC.19
MAMAGWRWSCQPTKSSPVATALRQHAFPAAELIPSTRPIGYMESWIAYQASCARQRRFREAPPIVTGLRRSLFVDTAGRLLSCGNDSVFFSASTSVAAMAGVRVRSVAAGALHSLAPGWDGRVEATSTCTL